MHFEVEASRNVRLDVVAWVSILEEKKRYGAHT